MKLAGIVPLGRSLREYTEMFALTPADLERDIIGIGDGPASFNAQMRRSGKRMVSIDPLYELGGDEIKTRFNASIDDAMAIIKSTPERWVWKAHASLDALRLDRERTLNAFLADYAAGLEDARYRSGALPQLDLADDAGDLILCSHLLFLYSDLLDLAFHLASIDELLRIGNEVRIFPIVTLEGERSCHLTHILKHVRACGHGCSIERVSYELQRGGNEMLRITTE